MIYRFVLPTEGELITTLLLRIKRIFCTDPLPWQAPVDRTGRSGWTVDTNEWLLAAVVVDSSAAVRAADTSSWQPNI